MALRFWMGLVSSAAFFMLLLLMQRTIALTPFRDNEELHVYGKAGDGVDITILEAAKQSGAVCLDGSAPAFHWRRGFGSGAKNWHIRLEGGGWCESASACAARTKTDHGSSKLMSNQILFNGLLNNKYSVNPDFYNWNHVYVRYCDGGSFSGDVAVPLKYFGQVLYFRGLRIFRAIIKHLQTKGLGTANQALLTGCSAGGLAVVHRCNDFKNLLPGVKVKCLSDAGFFVNDKTVTNGKYVMYSYYKGVANIHKLQNTLPSGCTKAKDPAQCFFPQQAQGYVQPPMFFVNSAYDYWQLENVKMLSWSQYSPCMKSASCSQGKNLQAFRQNLLNGLYYARSRAGWGSFVDACFSHCQVESDIKWTKPRVNGKSLARAVGDWYFGRSRTSYNTDCGFPSCNPTCVAYPLNTVTSN